MSDPRAPKPPYGQPPPGQPAQGHGQPQQPQPWQQPHPQQPYPQQPQPYPQPYPQQQQPYPQQPQPWQPPPPPPGAAPYPQPAATPAPYPQPAPQPPPSASVGTSFLRAMRLRIEPNEVTPGERDALTKQGIVDPRFQAFLAWRRSLLVLVAIALIPLTALRFYDAYKEPMPQMMQMLVLLPAAAEGLLCLVCWYQLKNWTRWNQQRRALIWTWIIFMIVPFLVFLIPTDMIVQEMVSAGGEEVDAAAVAAVAATLKVTIAVYALLTLAPKAVSLLAGTIRAGLVTKMLFAGAPGPGWLVVLATPIYALFVFTLLVVPYQLTGNLWFVAAMIGLAVAQIVNGRAGMALTRPMTHDEAVKTVGRARAIYMIAMLAFIGSLLAAVWPLASKIGASTIATTILAFETNVMILTLIGSDLLISGLAKAAVVANATHLDEEAEAQLAAFAK